MSDLTLGWLSILDAGPLDVVDAAAHAGFHSVSLRLTGRRRQDPFEDIIGSEQAVRDLGARLGGHGLRLSNVSTFHLSPDVTLDMLLPVLDATARLGCDTILATCADPDHARWLEFMARYCEKAGERGIRLALEFVPFSQAQSIRVAENLVRASGAPNLGIVVDALHLARSGGGPDDVAGIDPALIHFAQICDATAVRSPEQPLADEARTGRFYPGEGGLPVDAFLDALPKGIEIECEVPVASHRGLSPREQAVRSRRAVIGFLEQHFASRSQINPYT